MQKGQVIERSGRFYVRFYNGEGRMVAKRICDLSRHSSCHRSRLI
jgi:hypothetical protein